MIRRLQYELPPALAVTPASHVNRKGNYLFDGMNDDVQPSSTRDEHLRGQVSGRRANGSHRVSSL